MHGDHLDERQDRADKATGTGVCGDQMRGEGWQPARTSFDAVAWHLITTALGGARGTNQPGKKSELLDRVSNLRLRRLDHDCNGRLGRHRMIYECGPTCPRRFVVCGEKAVRINLLVGKLSLAGELGFEPRQTESESVVLPLHHSPPKALILLNFFWKFCNQGQEFCKPGDLQGPYSRACVRGLVFLC